MPIGWQSRSIRTGRWQFPQTVWRSATKGHGFRTHLKTALHLLGKRPAPDYRNAVKESISAVESVAKQLSKNESQGLAGALDELGKRGPIHGALKSAFLKLYGYTSDADGIRHAILDEPNVDFDEAKYMVVACSAFVNYLVTKANTAKLASDSPSARR